jgi:hypothetical protein
LNLALKLCTLPDYKVASFYRFVIKSKYYLPLLSHLYFQHRAFIKSQDFHSHSLAMLYQAYLFILMASTLCMAVNYPSHVRQPEFPAECTMTLTGDSVVRQLPPIVGPSFSFYRCTLVGGACKANSDCPLPKDEDCVIPPNPGRNPAAAPKRAHCIDGFCRDLSDRADDTCDCLIGCNFKLRASTRDMSCVQGRCRLAQCAPCGEPPNNRQCCGSGVVGQDGNCYCATGAGEGCAVKPDKCSSGSFNDECCGKGTKNEGSCCASGTCNGQCLHQP